MKIDDPGSSGKERDKIASRPMEPPYTLREGVGDPLKPWANQVQADNKQLAKSSVCLAWYLRESFHRSSGWAFPGIDTMSRDLRLNRSTVIRAIHELDARGHLCIGRGGGRNNVNLYRPVLWVGAAEIRSKPETVAQLRHRLPDENSGTAMPPFSSDGDAKQSHSGSETVAFRPLNSGTAMPPEPRNLEREPSRSVADATRPGDDAWKRFRAIYPKRDGANPWTPAEKKFRALMKAGANPEEIISGAERYAAELRTTGQERTRYVAQAVTWLNQQRWNDGAEEPAPKEIKTFEVREGTQEAQAWLDHFKRERRAYALTRMREDWTFGKPYLAISQWPPEYRAATQASQPNSHNGCDTFASVTRSEHVTAAKASQPLSHSDCDAVTLSRPRELILPQTDAALPSVEWQSGLQLTEGGEP
jgi:hypothetical protein